MGLARPAEIVDRYLRVWNANTDSDGKEVFTDVVQWQEPVDGADLLDEIEQMFTRHVILAAGASTAIALFIVHTFAFAAATISPLLGISSPVKR